MNTPQFNKMALGKSIITDVTVTYMPVAIHNTLLVLHTHLDFTQGTEWVN